MKPRLDPDADPISFDYKPGSGQVKLRLVVGSVVLAIVLVVIYLMREDAFVILVAGGFGLFALLNLIYGIIQSGFEKSFTITDTTVFVDSRTILGRNKWQEAVASYRGVLMRERRMERQSIGNIRSMKTYHIIEMDHPDPAKTLPLYVQQDGAPPRHLQEAFARRFALPALTPDSGGETARAADALDRTIAETAGTIYDPGPPPAGVKLRHDGETTRIALGQSRKGMIFLILYLLAVPIIFGGAAYQVDPIGGYVAAGMASVMVLIYFFGNFLYKRRGEKDDTVLCIDPERIWIEWPEAGSGLLSEFLARRLHVKRMQEVPQALPRDTVEQVRVDDYLIADNRVASNGTTRLRRDIGTYRLLIEGDQGRLAFPGGQSDEKKLRWVRNYLRFVLAGGVTGT